MDYALHLLTLMCIFAVLSVSLDLLIGHTGILSFAHAAFYGIGAYATAILTVTYGWGWLPAMMFAFVLGAALAIAIGIPTLRLGGDYFILALFGFQSIVISIILNWESLTNGPFGIRGIPRPAVGEWSVPSGVGILAFCCAVALLVFEVHRRFNRSPMRAVLHAIRDDDTVAQSLGINVVRTRIVVFAIGGGFAAIAGALLAFYFRFIDPTSFNFNTMILLWAMVFIGGSQRLLGAIVGPAILIVFPELFRFLGVNGTSIAYVQQGLYGLLLILLMMFRPQGLIGTGTRSAG